MKPLAVIPSYVRSTQDIHMLGECLASIQRTEGGNVDVLVVDDGSPDPKLVDRVEELQGFWPFELHRKDANEGYSRTINIGLRRAREEGRDAITVNQDIEFVAPWLREFQETPDQSGEGRAWVVGPLLVYPQPAGLVQEAGIFFSFLTRSWGHRHAFSPMNLPEVHIPQICPVTGACQYIRHECLKEIGLYDEENFRMIYNDVDYCLQVLMAGKISAYNPRVWAYHAESFTRKRRSDQMNDWERRDWASFCKKYAGKSFAALVPFH